MAFYTVDELRGSGGTPGMLRDLADETEARANDVVSTAQGLVEAYVAERVSDATARAAVLDGARARVAQLQIVRLLLIHPGLLSELTSESDTVGLRSPRPEIARWLRWVVSTPAYSAG